LNKLYRHIPSFDKPNLNDLFLVSSEHRFSYADLVQFQVGFSGLVNHKYRSAEEPIAFLADSSDVLVLCIASCWNLGIPFIPLSSKFTDDEIQEYLEILQPGLVLCDANNYERVQNFPRLMLKKDLLKYINPNNGSDVILKEMDVDFDADSIFGYFLTSGSTGPSKIVPLKRRQILFAVRASEQNFKPDRNAFWLHCMPFNHIGGVSLIIRSLLYGSAIYRMSHFDTEEVFRQLATNFSIQVASLVPTMLKRLLDLPNFQTHINFKAILLGGGPIAPALLEQALGKGVSVVPSYGMTETCAQIAANPVFLKNKESAALQSVGHLFEPNRVEIRDDQQNRVHSEETGTIWLKGPQIFDGYYDTEHNDSIFDESGWFNTGDLGRIDANQNLFIESRRSDLIITGGENVIPLQVEEAIQELPNVKDVAVIGLPDLEWGQRVTAVIQLLPEENLTLKTLRLFLKSRLTPFKIPKQLLLVDELPKTSSGKIKRNELVERFSRSTA